jgi:predicted metal-dependent peptidase
MKQTAEERITRSRVRLLLTKPFFGQLATRMKLIERPDMPTAATDGRNFFFNREFVDRLNDEELDFLVGHEVLHMVFDHIDARGDREPMIYNMACDFNINMTLVEQKVGTVIGEDKLNGGKPCLDWKYRGWNSYEIYDHIYENAEKIEIGSMDVHLEPGDGDPQSGGGNQDGDGDGQEGKGFSDGLTEEERKVLRDEIKQAVINAAQAGGEVPDVVKRMISELTAPKMDWRDNLRTQLESSLKSDFTFMRPSKRSGEVIFPGMNRDEQLRVAVFLDTSGSIGNDLLRDMLSEVQGIMGQYQDYEITIGQFDTSVYNVEKFTSDDGRDLSDYEIVGGGGTDFDAVYKYMEDEGLEPDQMIMFTDGYPWGSWGNPDYCDTLFVIHGDHAQRIQAPFGVTVHYD